MRQKLALGLDFSTQSLSAVVLDIDSLTEIYKHSLDFLKDNRLNGFGIRSKDYIVPPRVEGEADQPPEMLFASLDAMFSDLKDAGIALENIVIINTSGQQHSHVYLNQNASLLFSQLNEENSRHSDLVTLLEGCMAYNLTPIWMTSNTAKQAAFIRNHIGGREPLIKISGSDSPLRFTGVVMRRVAQQFPEAYRQTDNIQLISSLIPAVLTSNSKVPVDFGNACGMALMDYALKQWSVSLIRVSSDQLPGGEEAFQSKLPSIVPPDMIVGTIAKYFCMKYGFTPACKVMAGSGDNPQSKVLVAGDVLSLGTSFVNMVATYGSTRDISGFANAMYDGIGRPFMFGCRTNGAMVWDQLRAMYGMEKEEYGPAEKSLQQVPVAQNLVFWQPANESFPPSGSYGLTRIGDAEPDLGTDYAGLIESGLAAVFHHSRDFAKEKTEPLYVMGGAINSPRILRRVSAIWRRQVIPIDTGGAALGAAIAGVYTFLKSTGKSLNIEQLSAGFVGRGQVIHPIPEDVTAIHKPGGYLDRFADEEAKLIAAYRLM